jgi:phosphoserine phosphatase RsbU/P
VSSPAGVPDFEALFHTAPCGYLVTDESGTILLANSTVLGWLGYSEDEVLGAKPFASLLTGGGRIYHETHYRPTLQIHGEAHEIALELLTKTGDRIPTLVNSVLDHDAGIVQTIVFKATDRRAYESEIVRQRQRAEQSEAHALVTAQTLQRTLIPPRPPVIDGLDIGAAYRPAGDGSTIGGDFYDVFEFESADWLIAIGDVCGKGIDAAVVAGLARFTLRAAAVRSRWLDEVMHQVNDALLADDSDRFVTLLLTRFTRSNGSWQATLCRGGHPPPVLFRADQAPRLLGLPGGLVGAMGGVTYRHVDLPLEVGDLLVMYTDGVTEGRAAGEFYGEDRMIAHVTENRDLGSEELAESLVDDVLAFQHGNAADDIAVVIGRVL